MTDREAPVSVRVFTAFLVARAMFGIVYLAVAAGRLPIFWYHPLDHAWELASTPTGLGMGWYGTTLAALLASAVGFGITYAASARRPLSRMLARGAVVLAIARAGGLVLLVDFAYFGWTMTHQKVAPLTESDCRRTP